MRPVSLMPERGDGRAVDSTQQMQLILIAVVGVAAIAGYFGWSRLDSVRTETANLNTKGQTQEAEAQKLQQQIDEAGQRTDFSQLASSVERDLIGKVAERVDFARFTRELGQVTPDRVVELDSVQVVADSDPMNSSSADKVKISGTASNVETVAAYVTRLNAMSQVKGAHVTTTHRVELNGGGSAEKFEIGADLAGSSGADLTAGGDPSAQTVGDGGTSASELALVPEPGYGAAKHRAPTSRLADRVAELTALEKVSKDAASYRGDGS